MVLVLNFLKSGTMAKTTKTSRPLHTFLNATGKKLVKLSNRVNVILHAIKKEKPYDIDFIKVENDYRRLNHGCIDEFSLNYSFGWHAMHKKLNNMESKEALYLEVRNYLVNLEENGKI